ncbi:formylglycine-generating enzyme family protein [Solimonas sp. K1W22B-7]|uniref:formylglycine-generating enzyme family protein n=1 Tax=Solimonas sp. K1W22B-7 TaxID=2303331 RepID=UPI000E332A95|nr:formylglycine-generating enzyme family protein [Solimonas sp. K1W22B-7]AXQ27600.1 formylglycine-generating enzyme family protein [Solimonas sp. K1W22B-7]
MRTTAGAAILALAALGAGLGLHALQPAVPATGAAPDPLGSPAACRDYSGLPRGWGVTPRAGMLRVAAGRFERGSLRGYADERPLVDTRVDAFWMDRTEVSNAQFASFVAATAYVTEAERTGATAVFRVPPPDAAALEPGSGWKLLKGADWRHPEGPDSSIAGRDNVPVVNVSLADAQAYAAWLGRELPSEMQWEFAARAGRSNAAADAALLDAGQRPQANVWQGLFPIEDRGDDGFPGRAPVGCFAANPYGLHDMIGNVWEWTTDLYRGRLDAVAAAATPSAPRVIKGGSFLCADNYCVRSRASARHPQEPDLPTTHLGFRTVARD